MGEATSVAREPIPAGSNASRASQCEVVRVDENVAVNCWNDEASGGWLSEVMPSFFIMMFCAWTTGFVARYRDFLAKRSLRLIVNSSGCGRDLRRGGEATSRDGGVSVRTARRRRSNQQRWGRVRTHSTCKNRQLHHSLGSQHQQKDGVEAFLAFHERP